MATKILDGSFWNRRYEAYPLGSGVGSRGVFAKNKRFIVQSCIENENVKSIIDLGCGDLYWIKHMNVLKYVGMGII